MPAASTKPLARVNAKDGAELVYIPAGPFLMGDDDDAIRDYGSKARNNPRHTVNLSAYYMYKNLVTVRQYKKFCQANSRQMPSAPDFNPNWSKDDHPIVSVNWEDAVAYAQWAGGALPTEAQWEKAARGTDGRKYPWGNNWDTSKLWCSKKALGDAGGTHKVGDLGVSPYGCTDMAGNVWQWCRDWYDANYWNGRAGTVTDPENQNVGEKKYRVLRGGSWYNNYPGYFRAACRDYYGPAGRYCNNGFRCVLRADSN